MAKRCPKKTESLKTATTRKAETVSAVAKAMRAVVVLLKAVVELFMDLS